ncbi:hypothetical protein KKC94_01580 [Patescibacteria group bacterium]|nr:hypothetical protein [Patescibacteria group bacterium]
MALSDILEQIKKLADAEVEKLNTFANEQIYSIQKEFSEKRDKQKAEMEARVEDNIVKIKSRAKTFAKMQNRSALLKAKRELLQEVFTQSVKKLADSPNYVKILTALFKTAKKEFSEAKVIGAKGKEEETKKALHESGAEFELLQKTADIKGGFTLKAGDVEVDFSFESILEKELWNELEMKLNKALF